MAKGDKRRVELFELLSEQRTQVQAGSAPSRATRDAATKPAVAAAAVPRPVPSAPPASMASAGAREIVFSLDTAFVIFVGVVMLVLCAYYQGYKKGLAEQALLPKKASLPIEKRDEVKLARSLEGHTPSGITVTGREYTVKLRLSRNHSDPELERLQEDARYVRRILEAEFGDQPNMSVMIFDNQKIYALGLGLFKAKDDARITKIRQRFEKDAGPPTSPPQPYAGCTVAQTGLLGKVIWP